MDLIGIPHRIVVSDKLLRAEQFEYKARQSSEVQILSKFDVLRTLAELKH